MMIINLISILFHQGNYLQQHHQMEFCEIGIIKVAHEDLS